MKKIIGNLKNVPIYILAFFLFLLPWQSRLIISNGNLFGGYWEYGTVGLYVTEIIFLFLLPFLLKDALKFLIKEKKQVFKMICVLFIFLAISSLWAEDRIVALLGLFRIFEAFSLGLIIYNTYQNKKHNFILYSFISGVLVQSILGIVQVINQWIPASTLFGIALHDPSVPGTYVVETVAGRFLRAYGGFPHPNIFGGYLVIGFLIILNLLLKQEVKYKRVLFLIAESLMIVALFFTFSRSAWLALIVGIVAIVVFNFNKFKNFNFIIYLSIFVFIFGVLGFVFRDKIETRIFGGTRLENLSVNERVASFDEAKILIKNNWLFGVGLGNYTFSVSRLVKNLPSWTYQPIHNIPILMFTELGLIGLIIFAFLFFRIFKDNLFNWKKQRDVFFLGLPIICSLFTIGLFDHYIWSLYSGLMLVGFTGGLFLNDS